VAVALARRAHLVAGSDQGGEDDEVDAVSPPRLVEGDGVSGCLGDQSAEQVRATHDTVAAGERDGDIPGAVKGLLCAGGLQGRPAGRALAGGGSLAEVARDEDVDAGGGAHPTVMVAVPRLAGRHEAHLRQGCGERQQRARLRSHIEQGIQVVGRARRRGATLGAVQVHHLPADQGPAGRVLLVQVEDR